MHRIASNRHPVVFVARYLWRHRVANAFIIVAILGAVAASVGARSASISAWMFCGAPADDVPLAPLPVPLELPAGTAVGVSTSG